MIKDDAYFNEIIGELKSMGEWNLSKLAKLIVDNDSELADKLSFYLESFIVDDLVLEMETL
jgi:hypothetical protein